MLRCLNARKQVMRPPIVLKSSAAEFTGVPHTKTRTVYGYLSMRPEIEFRRVTLRIFLRGDRTAFDSPECSINYKTTVAFGSPMWG